MRDWENIGKEFDARNKRWQYRTRRIVLFFLITGGILTIYEKCPTFKRKQTNTVPSVSADSPKQEKRLLNKQPASVPRKSHQWKPDTETPTTKESSQSSTQYSDNTVVPLVEKPKLQEAYPVQISNSDDIQFKLLKAEGSKGAQTIKITMVLTTNAANRFIWSQVNSIIDPEGNEYKIKSFTNGASSSDSHVALNTGVPIKLTYTFGGVLPSVRYIKLFKFEYRHKSLDDNIAVEFRDVFVEWK